MKWRVWLMEVEAKKRNKTGILWKTDYWPNLNPLLLECLVYTHDNHKESHLCRRKVGSCRRNRRLFHITNIVHWYKTERPLHLQEMSQIGTVTWQSTFQRATIHHKIVVQGSLAVRSKIEQNIDDQKPHLI